MDQILLLGGNVKIITKVLNQKLKIEQQKSIQEFVKYAYNTVSLTGTH